MDKEIKKLRKQVAMFEKMKAKRNLAIVNFTKNDIEKNFPSIKLLMYESKINQKTLRICLFNAVDQGCVEASLYFAKILQRELTYNEKSKLAKESQDLDFIKSYFPGKLAHQNSISKYQRDDFIRVTFP